MGQLSGAAREEPVRLAMKENLSRRAPLLHFKRHAISYAEFETLNQLVLCLCCATIPTLVFLLKSQHSPVEARIDREVE